MSKALFRREIINSFLEMILYARVITKESRLKDSYENAELVWLETDWASRESVEAILQCFLAAYNNSERTRCSPHAYIDALLMADGFRIREGKLRIIKA